MIYPHSQPPNTIPLHSTSKIESLTQPVISQCTHIYLTNIDRLEWERGEREREGGRRESRKRERKKEGRKKRE